MNESDDITFQNTCGHFKTQDHEYTVAGISRIVAIVAAVVALLVSFTELAFTGLEAETITPTLAVMIVCSYLMYFSLESTGERAGMEDEDYKGAVERFKTAKTRIKPAHVGALREFCADYSKSEHAYRRISYLISHGYSSEEYEAYKSGCRVAGSARRVFCRLERIKPRVITPAMLIGGGRVAKSSELDNPERTKAAILAARLVPTTVCMIFTASIALSLKGDLGTEAVIEALIKLSTLPLVALKGYCAGLAYVRGPGTEWLLTRARLLESFLEGCEERKNADAA